MLFSSTVFLYAFLPAVVFVYYVFLRKSRILQNIFLMFASLFFYAWGEPKFVLVMILSIIANWIFGLFVEKEKTKGKTTYAKAIIVLTVVFNISILFVFKYLSFSVNNINSIFSTNISIKNIALPIGISFFTFQAMSYVIDVYRGKGTVQNSIINVGLYISFFPQLIAGPIVRYETIADQILNRKETIEDFFSGFTRFVFGLSKKVLLANSFGIIADRAFNCIIDGDKLSALGAWLGAICYTLQIFYDFSGYSDMAIGLGKMFGFHFLENFEYPYVSTSITEFWRRWHISLGTWFRDYVYIPLGGSRVKKPRMVFNLFVVWLLTGIWHGANWTFIVWGLMYFVLLTTEKLTGFYKIDKRYIKPLFWLYSMFFVVIGWVIFRSDSISLAINYIGAMFGNKVPFSNALFVDDFKQILLYMVVGIIFSFPISKWVKKKHIQNVFYDSLYVIIVVLLFVASIASIVSSSYNPFIYFNF
ncbi:MAG: MBOAT family protein [Eubacterium sp.]|nr:MBOAT family protein [Eubacterium sp.]